MKNYGEELGWELDVDFPSWGNTEIYVKTISKGYLLAGEKPKDAYWRVATAVAKRLGKPALATKFFDYIWKGWLCLATPVLSNTGTDRGLPISCFGIDVGDSIFEIGNKNLELMLLAKHGGGVGIGRSIHAGQVSVADGTELAAQKLQRVLTNDPGMGVIRHVDAGYPQAVEVARAKHVHVPMLDTE